MNIETAPVERRYVSHEIRMVGKVDYDETKLGYITAWVSGRLDRLYVDYTGVQVNKGDHMVYIYSEELYSAQQELIQALRFARERGRSSDIGGVNLLEVGAGEAAAAGPDGRADQGNRAAGQADRPLDDLLARQRHRHREAQARRRAREARRPHLHDRRSESGVGASGRLRIGPAVDSLRPGRDDHHRSLSRAKSFTDGSPSSSRCSTTRRGRSRSASTCPTSTAS